MPCGVVMMKKIRSFGYMLKKSLSDDIKHKEQIRIKYRPYQQRIVETFEQGQRLLLICWARRLGKDMMTFSLAAKQCTDNPNSTVFYMFPTQKQGKQMLLERYSPDLHLKLCIHAMR